MTQKQKIKNHLLQHGKISTYEAIGQYRVTRLAEYIRQLRKEMTIISERKEYRDHEGNYRWYVNYKYNG